MDGSHVSRTISRSGSYAPGHDSERPDCGPGVDPESRRAAFMQWLEGPSSPCVGAQLAQAQGNVTTVLAPALGSQAAAAPTYEAVRRFLAAGCVQSIQGHDVHTLAVVYDGPRGMDEPGFERLLWAQLQRLHELDLEHGERWCTDVSADPSDPRFSFSLQGHPWFVIGLHPGASRVARRAPSPVLVFNSHHQFNALKADGRYAKMQEATRERDRQLQGSINPMLADHGEVSEARQYSGRAVGRAWRCPFHARG